MKHYLAFKGVSANLKSAFVRCSICRRYNIGKTMHSHPLLPFFIISNYSKTNWRLDTGCDAYIERILLVRIFESNLTDWTPWATVNVEDAIKVTLEEVAQKSTPRKRFKGATRLTVLDEVIKTDFSTADKAMRFYEEKYGISRIPNTTNLN